MPEWVPPRQLLGELAAADIRWRVDYSQATSDEVFVWGREDLVARIVAALFHNRTVRFEDPGGARIWRTKSKKKATRLAGEIEDTLVNSGMNIYLKIDDEKGVVIGVAGPENPIQ
jgi:hypothetical protein